jgi:hypothetical protein
VQANTHASINNAKPFQEALTPQSPEIVLKTVVINFLSIPQTMV